MIVWAVFIDHFVDPHLRFWQWILGVKISNLTIMQSLLVLWFIYAVIHHANIHFSLGRSQLLCDDSSCCDSSMHWFLMQTFISVWSKSSNPVMTCHALSHRASIHLSNFGQNPLIVWWLVMQWFISDWSNPVILWWLDHAMIDHTIILSLVKIQ